MTDNATNRDARERKRKVSAFTAVLVLIGAGTAVSYWTGLGAGTDSADTSSAVTNLEVNQTSAVTELQPGGSPQALSGNFDNPNTGPVYVTTVTVSIASVDKAVGAPAGTCDATDYTLANATMTVGTQVPSGMGVGAWGGASIAFNNKPSTNQDACKGATVNLAYAVS